MFYSVILSEESLHRSRNMRLHRKTLRLASLAQDDKVGVCQLLG